MKGYSRLETAQAAAERMIARGYGVTIDKRNGWYVLHLTGEPVSDDSRAWANDNIPDDDRSKA